MSRDLTINSPNEQLRKWAQERLDKRRTISDSDATQQASSVYFGIL